MYCSSTATMRTRTRLNVALYVHCRLFKSKIFDRADHSTRPEARKTSCSATCVWHEHNFSVVFAQAFKQRTKTQFGKTSNITFLLTHAAGRTDEFPPKRRYLSSRLHGVISHKTVIQSYTDVSISVLLYYASSACTSFAPLKGAHTASACLRYVKVEQLN
jgi:hypothetical protein